MTLTCPCCRCAFRAPIVVQFYGDGILPTPLATCPACKSTRAQPSAWPQFRVTVRGIDRWRGRAAKVAA